MLDLPFLIFLLAIVLSVLPFTDSDCTFGILWPLCCLSFHLRILFAPVVCPSIYGFWLHLWFLVAIVLSVLPFTDSDCTCCLSFHLRILITDFGILWPLCCLSVHLRILIAPLVSCGHCAVCPSIYGIWWHLWYLVAIVLSVLPFTDSDCTLSSNFSDDYW